MRRIALVAIITGFLVPFLSVAPASAQATRTWVSGVGDDANPCSRTAPCKTFAGAISKTADRSARIQMGARPCAFFRAVSTPPRTEISPNKTGNDGEIASTPP